MNRTAYITPVPSEREELLNQAGTGDLELTDLYNAEQGTKLPSPLSLEHLRWAVGIKMREGRNWLK